MSTRPRIEFNDEGWCNSCQWMLEKKKLDWGKRQDELTKLLTKYRSKKGAFDCLVPVSGGKDGAYIAHQLKHKYKMNPLTVTIAPQLPLKLGEQNLKNFINSGYNNILISPNKNIMQKLNKYGFIEKGFPYYGWLIAVQSAVVRAAINFDVPLIFYAEDGEVEYGGTRETINISGYDVEYMQRIYLEDGHGKVLKKSGIPESELYFWLFPSISLCKEKNIYITHWSYFENWDPYRNYLVAKERCGLIEQDECNVGTFTNFAQNDQALYTLHTYMMYLKFGFGRATQDAGIEIRRGSMTREQAKQLVIIYDGQYPEEFLELYLDHFEMEREEFDAVLDKFTNKGLFKKYNGRWHPTFKIE